MSETNCGKHELVMPSGPTGEFYPVQGCLCGKEANND